MHVIHSYCWTSSPASLRFWRADGQIRRNGSGTGDRFMNMDEFELEREASAPIDMLETYFSALGWAYERNGEDEIVVELPGQLDAI